MTALVDNRTTRLRTRPPVRRPAPQHELQFARGAALYLDRMGLDRDGIVKALVEELDLDLLTAEAIADLT